MDCLSVFNPSRLHISSLHSYILSLLFLLMLPFSLLFSFLFQIWLYERLWLLHRPTVPPSQYLPKHYRDRRPKRAKMSLDEFTEFMKHVEVSNIQWVVDWWRILGMVSHSFKDNCVPLVGLPLLLLLYMPYCKAI